MTNSQLLVNPISGEVKIYYPRLISPVILAALEDTPVVILLGSRQSGKTTLAGKMVPDRPIVSLDSQQAYQTALADPDGFVDALPEYVTLDEVQRVPQLLPAIKRSVDNNRQAGRFLLTGSANLLLLPKVSESLAGRMEIVQLHPLTESEKELTKGNFLRDWMAGRIKPEISGDTKQQKNDWLKRVIEGGYPEPLTRTAARARQWHRQYLRGLLQQDVQDVAAVKDSDALRRVLETAALQSGQLLNISSMSKSLGIHRATVEQYLLILERLFLLRRLPAWHSNASRRLIKSSKIHITDTGLASTVADLSLEDRTNSRNSLGHLLESFVVQQLIAQSAWTDPDTRFWHYRDKDKVEVDLVITLGRKTWGVEVKSSARVTTKDTMGLGRLASQCGAGFQGGIVLYSGNDILPLGDKRLMAVPLKLLWDR